MFDENGNLLLASDFTELNLCYGGKGYMALRLMMSKHLRLLTAVLR